MKEEWVNALNTNDANDANDGIPEQSYKFTHTPLIHTTCGL